MKGPHGKVVIRPHPHVEKFFAFATEHGEQSVRRGGGCMFAAVEVVAIGCGLFLLATCDLRTQRRTADEDVAQGGACGPVFAHRLGDDVTCPCKGGCRVGNPLGLVDERGGKLPRL